MESRTFSADLDLLAFLGGDLALPSSTRPRFGDEVWDLSALAIPAYARTPGRARLEWSRIAAEHWRLCAKEVGLALLAPRVGITHRLPGVRRHPVPVHDLGRYLGMWQRWFSWLGAHGVFTLGQVSEPTRCANATIHPVHVPVWVDTRRHLDGLLASTGVPAQESSAWAPSGPVSTR